MFQKTLVQTHRNCLGIRFHTDVDDRKIVYQTECLDRIVPLSNQSVGIYYAFCLASVKWLSVKIDGVVRQDALLCNVPS